MNKLYVITDGNEILGVDFNKEKANKTLEYILEEEKYIDNEYIRANIIDVEYEGTVIKNQENVVGIVMVYNTPVKAFVNDSIAAYQYRIGLGKDSDESGKYTTKYIVVR